MELPHFLSESPALLVQAPEVREVGRPSDPRKVLKSMMLRCLKIMFFLGALKNLRKFLLFGPWRCREACFLEECFEKLARRVRSPVFRC